MATKCAQFRNAEVEDFDPAVGRHEHVFRFQVAMDDPFRVRRREPARNLDGVLDRPAR